MKKIITLLLLSFIYTSNSLYAQLQLLGTQYLQKFNELDTALPEGWHVFSEAKFNSLGILQDTNFIKVRAANTRWSNATGGFKNVASANEFSFHSLATNAKQLDCKDRALGLKQTGTFGDPGTAFALCLENTYQLKDFSLDFKIQSLDSSNGGRTTNWIVQIGYGINPKEFITVPTTIIETGNHTFSNEEVHVNFDTLLNDIRDYVWIRIVTNKNTTGSGSRATTAIDDFELTWDGIGRAHPEPFITTITPSKNNFGYYGSHLNIHFSKPIHKGTTGNVYIGNFAKGLIQTIPITSTEINIDDKTLTVSGILYDFMNENQYWITLDSNLVFHDTFGNEAFIDTNFSPFFIFGSYLDRTFIYDMNFANDLCRVDNYDSLGWHIFNYEGESQWHCLEYATDSIGLSITGSDSETHDDWVVSPKFYNHRFLTPHNHNLSILFNDAFDFNDSVISVLYSKDYIGSGDPRSYKWNDFGVLLIDGIYKTSSLGNYYYYHNDSFHIAVRFHTNKGYNKEIVLKKINLESTDKINEKSSKSLNSRYVILGETSKNRIEILDQNNTPTLVEIQLYNLNSQLMGTFKWDIINEGIKKIIDPKLVTNGIYILKIGNEDHVNTIKISVVD